MLNTPDTPQIAAQAFFVAHGILPIAGAETPPATQAEPSAQPAAGGDGGQEPAAAQQPAGVDPAIMARMDQVASQIGELAQRLPAPEPTPDPTQEAVRAQLDELFGQTPQAPANGADPAAQQPQTPPGGLPQDEAEFLKGMIREEASEIARSALQPVLTGIEADRRTRDAERRSREAEDLLDQYPELGQADVRGAITTQAREWAGDIGQPALAGEPAFVELVLLAAKQAEAAAGETPADANQGGTTLQPSGGGSPSLAQVPEQQRADRIANAGKHHSFWG